MGIVKLVLAATLLSLFVAIIDDDKSNFVVGQLLDDDRSNYDESQQQHPDRQLKAGDTIPGEFIITTKAPAGRASRQGADDASLKKLVKRVKRCFRENRRRRRHRHRRGLKQRSNGDGARNDGRRGGKIKEEYHVVAHGIYVTQIDYEEDNECVQSLRKDPEVESIEPVRT